MGKDKHNLEEPASSSSRKVRIGIIVPEPMDDTEETLTTMGSPTRNLLGIFPSICSDALPYYQKQYTIEIRPKVITEIDQVIENNLENSSLIAFFLSITIKGFQNLSNEELEIHANWGNAYAIRQKKVMIFSGRASPCIGCIG